MNQKNKDQNTDFEKNFVQLFRSIAPYIHSFKSKIFVICISKKEISDKKFNNLIHDIALLNALGIKIIVTYNAMSGIETQLKIRNHQLKYSKGIPITDEIVLDCAKRAIGEYRLNIEASFSTNLPNTPMTNSKVRVVSGNFVKAKPLGVYDSVDFNKTGVVRKIDTDNIIKILESGAIVLIPPLGFSETGDAFNLSCDQLAVSIASELKSEKLIFTIDKDFLPKKNDSKFCEISHEKINYILNESVLHEGSARLISQSTIANENGVERVHLIPLDDDGEILLELFTHDGIGTMLVKDKLDFVRSATLDDVSSILSLIEPFEKDGTLSSRSKLLIERDIKNFSVLEHDGIIYGCAGLYEFPEEKIGEIACLIISSNYQEKGEGKKLLNYIEKIAKSKKLKKLFALTTRTEHWFLKNQFKEAKPNQLPKQKINKLTKNRNSKILIKILD